MYAQNHRVHSSVTIQYVVFREVFCGNSEGTEQLHSRYKEVYHMGKKQILPIGRDDFREIREGGFYYVDKTLMIQEFLELRDKIALIARPRRFGKTLNMTMLRDFFDITQDSQELFNGLAIMDTEYADQINSKPVIYLSLKDCKGSDADQMFDFLREEFFREYCKFEEVIGGKIEKKYERESFYATLEMLQKIGSDYHQYGTVLLRLVKIVNSVYKIPPLLFIDEYDQPIMSSYEYSYHDEIGSFFANLYGSVLKGNSALGQALLTGVQRVAKESIFSQLNNVRVYTVLHQQYAQYFGLTAVETGQLLLDYDLHLDDTIKQQYNGYCFGGIQMYNPWSILNYADMKILDNYWVKTSANVLIKEVLEKSDRQFWDKFDWLLLGETMEVQLNLETSYMERVSNYSLWGLLVNSGYLTVIESIDANSALVKIPNGEVLSEFRVLIAEISGIERSDLEDMFASLRNKDMDGFLIIYRRLVLACTSYMDAKENAYHMLFLGMCMTLRGAYEVRSNMEAGHGRSDIILKSLRPTHGHMIIEFKQSKKTKLGAEAQKALKQIKEKEYDVDLTGEVICIGLAHDKKRCEMVYEVIQKL